MDRITGLSPVISIEQKTTNRNPRSTVGTTTEIYDFLRVLYARAGEAFSYESGERMVKYTEEQVVALILERYRGRKIYILAPVVQKRKGHYKELFESLRRRGYMNVRVDGALQEIRYGMKLDRYKIHNVEVVIDKMRVDEDDRRRLTESLNLAMRLGEGLVMVLDADSGEVRHYSKRLMDPLTGLSYSEPAPHNFSFNSPYGACPRCKGLGVVNRLDMEKIVPDPSLSIYEGGIVALGKYKKSLIFSLIESLCTKRGFTIRTPIRELPEELMDEVMNGTSDRLKLDADVTGYVQYLSYEGVAKYIRMQQEEEATASAQRWAEQFVKIDVCPECHGLRLNREALHYRICGRNIAELAGMDISELKEWLEGLEDRLDGKQRLIATEILKEIRTRLNFLLDVGLDYLSLSRASASLSGGESQRIRLATQIGTELVNVLYILDEPSIGLHQRDNMRLINSLKRLRDIGNSVGHRGGTRQGHDAERRLYCRHGPARRAAGGRGRLRGYAGGDAQEPYPHVVLPQRGDGDRHPEDAAEGERAVARPARGEGEQPEGRGRFLPAGDVHLRDGRLGQRQVLAHQPDAAAHPEPAVLPVARGAFALPGDRGHRIY